MPELGGYFLGDDRVGIGMAEQRSPAAAAVVELAAGHTVALEHQWAFGFAKEKYMVCRPE